MTNDTKATEPSDEELAAIMTAANGGNRGAASYQYRSERALYNAGRASRDAEVAELRERTIRYLEERNQLGEVDRDRLKAEKRVTELEAELAAEKGRGDFHRDIAAQVTDKSAQLDGSLAALEFAAKRDIEQHQLIRRLESDLATVTRERDELKARDSVIAWMCARLCVDNFADAEKCKVTLTAAIDSLTRELAKANKRLADVRTILVDFDERHPSGDEVGIRLVASKAATKVLRLQTDKSALLAKVAEQQTELSEALAAVEELDTAVASNAKELAEAKRRADMAELGRANAQQSCNEIELKLAEAREELGPLRTLESAARSLAPYLLRSELARISARRSAKPSATKGGDAMQPAPMPYNIESSGGRVGTDSPLAKCQCGYTLIDGGHCNTCGDEYFAPTAASHYETAPRPTKGDNTVVWAAKVATPTSAWEIKHIVTWPGNEWLREYLYPSVVRVEPEKPDH